MRGYCHGIRAALYMSWPLGEHGMNKKEYDKKYYLEHKSSKLEKQKEYNQGRKEEISTYQQSYRQDNKEQIKITDKKYRQERRKNDPAYRLRSDMSRVIRLVLRQNNATKRGQSYLQYLEYTIDGLKSHLENNFESWMTWDNHGKYDWKTWDDNDPSTWTWQIDHIVPQSSLPYTSMEEENFKKCWALDNLRPLSAKQNLLEGATRIRHKIGEIDD